jgi:hypothetical protein
MNSYEAGKSSGETQLKETQLRKQTARVVYTEKGITGTN